MPREKQHKGPKIIAHRKPDARKERCQVCKLVMERVTPGHLREHGLSIARYERMYGERRLPSRAERGSVTDPNDPNQALLAAVGDRLTESKVWIACIAEEVSERMLNGPLRLRLTAMLTTMLFQRAKVHGESVAILSSALEELREEWRIAQGGENGGPTDTETLLRLVDRAAKLVGDSEDAVQRTIKLALEEQKAAHQYADAIGPTLYTGTGEKLDMPAGLPSSDRETMRNLLALIGKAANERGTIDAVAVQNRVPDAMAIAIHPPTPPGSSDGHRESNRVPDAMTPPLQQGNEHPPTPSPPGGTHPPGTTPPPPGRTKGSKGRASRGSLADPASAPTRSPSTPAPSTPGAGRVRDADRRVNDPARSARTGGSPPRHGECVRESGDGGEGVIVNEANTPPHPPENPGGDAGVRKRPRPDGGRTKRERIAKEWKALQASRGIEAAGKGKKAPRGPNRGNDTGKRKDGGLTKGGRKAKPKA